MTFKCGETPVENSLCMIEVILKDIKDTYTLPGGGGIGQIKAIADTTFTVSIAQEERVDLITYELEINGDAATIKTRTEGTKSYP